MEAITTALRGTPATARSLRSLTAIGKDRLQRLLDITVSEGLTTTRTVKIRGNDCNEYHLAK